MSVYDSVLTRFFLKIKVLSFEALVEHSFQPEGSKSLI